MQPPARALVACTWSSPGEDVTECTGGARELTEVDLERAYRSSVDPRLNYEQSLEIAMAIVRKQGQRSGDAST